MKFLKMVGGTFVGQFSYRSSHPEVLLGKGVLKIYSKFTGEYPCRCVISIQPCRRVISIKLQSNFVDITLWHGCSPDFAAYFQNSFS